MSFYATAVIAIALGVGWYLFKTRSTGADATYDAFAAASSVIWVLTGIFLILGGFYLVGGLVIAIFFWLALTKGEKTKERLRARLAN